MPWGQEMQDSGLSQARATTPREVDLGHQAPESIINVLLLETRSPHDHNVVPTRPLSHAGAGAGGCDADHHVQGGEGGAAPCYPGGGAAPGGHDRAHNHFSKPRCEAVHYMTLCALQADSRTVSP